MGLIANQMAVELFHKLVEKIKDAPKEDESQEKNDRDEKRKEQKS